MRKLVTLRMLIERDSTGLIADCCHRRCADSILFFCREK
jgi:hypothetical protein